MEQQQLCLKVSQTILILLDGGKFDKYKVNIFYTAPTALRALNERR